MGFSKDQWTRPVRQPDGTVTRVRNDRLGKGKRWLAVWHDEAGREKSQAFQTKAAGKHWQGLESGRAREVLAEAARKRTGEHAVEEGTRRYKERADGPAAAREGPG